MGKLTIVGIGPGNYDNMTIAADRALRESQLIVGYTVYVDLVQERYPGKELLSTPMNPGGRALHPGAGRSGEQECGAGLLRRQWHLWHGCPGV